MPRKQDEVSAMPVAEVRELVEAVINRTKRPEEAADEFAKYLKDDRYGNVLLVVLRQAVGSRGSTEMYAYRLRTWVHIESGNSNS